jgi:hypothetical protein
MWNIIRVAELYVADVLDPTVEDDDEPPLLRNANEHRSRDWLNYYVRRRAEVDDSTEWGISSINEAICITYSSNASK